MESFNQNSFSTDLASLHLGDSLQWYGQWERQMVIVSDGAYGVSGFDGDTADHHGIAEWYRPHVEMWSRYARPDTTLWFWNSEIGWAATHHVLEENGWKYQNCNVWNKGMAHVAGNVNTSTIRRFPVVSEVCVQYVRDNRIDGMTLQEWMRHEWGRTGLPFNSANSACNVKAVATRKHLCRDGVWYFPRPDMFEAMSKYANEHGRESGKPYYSIDGIRPMTGSEWEGMRSKFKCPYGFTNVWDRPPVSGNERIRENGRAAVHPNQKPIDLMEMIIRASSDEGDVVWEPFGGLFTASLAATNIGRRAFAAEINRRFFSSGVGRFL